MNRVLPGAASGPMYFNGSGSCRGLRTKAARELGDAIHEAIAGGAKLAEPDEECLQIVRDVAAFGDESEYVLTRTYAALADCIRAHEYAAHGAENAFADFADAYRLPAVIEHADGSVIYTGVRQAGQDELGYDL
jgi:hypothetical protein